METRGGMNPCSTKGSGMPTADLFSQRQGYTGLHFKATVEYGSQTVNFVLDSKFFLLTAIGA